MNARASPRDEARGGPVRWTGPPSTFPVPPFLEVAISAALTLVATLGVGTGSLSPAEQLWLCITLGASQAVTEELAPLVGGLAVSQGRVALGPVLLALSLGGWILTGLLYVLGRWRGRWVRRRFPRVGTTMKRWLRAVRRRPWRSALSVRFFFGARLLLPLACGAAHVRPDVFLIGSLVSSIVWSTVFVLLGFWFGDDALAAIAWVRRYDQYAAGVIAGLIVLAWLMLRRRARARALRLAIASGREPLPGA